MVLTGFRFRLFRTCFGPRSAYRLPSACLLLSSNRLNHRLLLASLLFGSASAFLAFLRGLLALELLFGDLCGFPV